MIYTNTKDSVVLIPKQADELVGQASFVVTKSRIQPTHMGNAYSMDLAENKSS